MAWVNLKHGRQPVVGNACEENIVRIVVLLVLCLAAIAAAPLAQAADERGWWEFWKPAQQQANVADQLFTAEETRLIRSYFHQQPDAAETDFSGKGRDKPKKQKRLPPGLQKKIERGGELPPGWQKKLARGEVLDADLYAASRPLPPDLLERLGGGPAGTETIRVEDEVVRVLEATGVIVDVLGL